MEAFRAVTGIAAAMPAANLDTDVIMPKQFLKGVDRKGLARGAFHHLRFDENGAPRPDFVLNQPPWTRACFLIVGPNFGCGSSREHAVWGLSQLGIRALVGTSFAGIFFDNCARNGLLAITLDSGAVEALQRCAATPDQAMMTIDLEAQTIVADGLTVAFDVEPTRRRALLEGLDAVGLALERAAAVRAFESRHFMQSPWLGRPAPTPG